MPKPPLPKDADPEAKAALWRAAAAKLTLEECRELLAAAPESKGRFGRRGGGAKKKATAPIESAAPKKAAKKKGRAKTAKRKAPARVKAAAK